MTRTVGWIGLAFFGLMLILVLRRLQRVGIAFRIDANGIEHSQMVGQTFAWDEITMLAPIRISGQPMVCYDVVPERLADLGAWRARLASVNRSTTGCAFAMAMAGTDATMADVLAALQRFAPDRLLTFD